MYNDLPKVVRDSADITAITQLILRERESRDMGKWDTIKRDDAWRIFSFDCIYMRDGPTPTIAGQSISINPAEVEGFRPSYRHLAWCLMKTGYQVDQDLPGEDRPETVTALMHGVESWAGL